MEFANHLILAGSALLLISILAGAASARIGAPLLLVFLILGMLAGEEGPGGIRFDDVRTSYLVGTLSLAVILFDGGLRTRAETFRVGLWPALSLATVGVLITSAVVGVFAARILGLPLLHGLLVGAIVGSTDVAAVFSLLHAKGMSLKRRVASTLEIESGVNDPTAIFLTVVLIELLTTGNTSAGWTLAFEFVKQFGIAAIFGMAGGKALAWIINRLALAAGLYPLLAVSGGVLIFAAGNHIGGSGFMAIYLAGIVLGNSRLHQSETILRVHDGLAWLAQIVMFLMLGLQSSPRELLVTAPQASLIALVLMLIARPLAVLISLLPFRFPWPDQVYIGWVGLRGAVPIVMALFPFMAGLPNAGMYFNVAFFVVILSLLFQGWTVAPAARFLRLELPPDSDPVQRLNLDIPGDFERELLCYRVASECLAANLKLGELPLPENAQVALVVRGSGALNLRPDMTLAAGDSAYVLALPRQIPAINRLFDPHLVPDRLEEHRFFGDFTLNGDADLATITEMYGFSFQNAKPGDSLARYLDRAFHKRPVVGDRVRIGSVEFVVRDVEADKITKVGLRIR